MYTRLRGELGVLARAVVLACGCLAIWVGAWYVIIPVTAMLWISDRAIERIQLTDQGEAIIHRIDSATGTNTYATLDGAPWEPNSNARFGTHLPGKDATRRNGLSWWERVQRFRPVGENGEAKLVDWFLVNDGRAMGHAYFEGFGVYSRRREGYLGVDGFHRDVPPIDKQFVIPATISRMGSVVPPIMQTATTFALESSKLKWMLAEMPVYLVSADRLYRIALTQRQVTVDNASGKTVSVMQGPSHLNQLVAPADSAKISELALSVDVPTIVVRFHDRVEVRSAIDKMLATYPLPAELSDETFEFYPIDAGRFVARLPHQGDLGGTLVWVDAQGKVTERREVMLASRSIGDTAGVAMFSVLFPSLLLDGAILGMMAPTLTTFRFEPFMDSLRVCWPVPVLLFLISIYCARKAWHMELAAGGKRGAAYGWALVVFLLGPAGLVGYWLARRWPVSEKCVHCGKVAPCEGSACRACGHARGVPARTGIEIFAPAGAG